VKGLGEGGKGGKEKAFFRDEQGGGGKRGSPPDRIKKVGRSSNWSRPLPNREKGEKEGEWEREHVLLPGFLKGKKKKLTRKKEID